jgi:hypothetical protein
MLQAVVRCNYAFLYPSCAATWPAPTYIGTRTPVPAAALGLQCKHNSSKGHSGNKYERYKYVVPYATIKVLNSTVPAYSTAVWYSWELVSED